MEYLEDIQNHRLQGIGSKQAILRAEYPALVVAPCLHQYDASLEETFPSNHAIDLRQRRIALCKMFSMKRKVKKKKKRNNWFCLSGGEAHTSLTFSRKHTVESPPTWLNEISTGILLITHFTIVTCHQTTRALVNARHMNTHKHRPWCTSGGIICPMEIKMLFRKKKIYSLHLESPKQLKNPLGGLTNKVPRKTTITILSCLVENKTKSNAPNKQKSELRYEKSSARGKNKETDRGLDVPNILDIDFSRRGGYPTLFLENSKDAICQTLLLRRPTSDNG